MDTNQVTNQLNEATETVGRMTENAKRRFTDVSNKLVERSKDAAQSTDAYVREYAWSSIALAALLGVVVGLMIRRS